MMSCHLFSLLLLLCLVSTALSVQDAEEDGEEDSGARDRVTEVVPGLSKLEKVLKKTVPQNGHLHIMPLISLYLKTS